MDKNKNAQGQQKQSQQKQGQQGQGSKDREWNESGRDQNTGNRGNAGGPERGIGKQGEKNSSGISKRGMDRSEEQADLPSRGSSDEDWGDQSER
jgi:hypothetical protein